MEVAAILALAGELADLANGIIAANKAKDQAEFDRLWGLMQVKLGMTNEIFEAKMAERMKKLAGPTTRWHDLVQPEAVALDANAKPTPEELKAMEI